jgi:hypothetical protein
LLLKSSRSSWEQSHARWLARAGVCVACFGGGSARPSRSSSRSLFHESGHRCISSLSPVSLSIDPPFVQTFAFHPSLCVTQPTTPGLLNLRRSIRHASNLPPSIKPSANHSTYPFLSTIQTCALRDTHSLCPPTFSQSSTLLPSIVYLAFC